MTTRFKKNMKKRGRVSISQDRLKKYRNHPGGHGNADMYHHRILFDKYKPSYFGKNSPTGLFEDVIFIWTFHAVENGVIFAAVGGDS
ncbi:hypothetical protein RYX36_034743 [Vicia faba]